MKRALCLLVICCSLGWAQVTYKVRLTNAEGNRIIELSAEKYTAGVLAGESSVFHSDEALKAMAVAARAYAARFRGRHAREGFDFCATTHCQRVDLSAITARTARAASETAGELLWFEGRPAFTAYSRSCGGVTEAVGALWPDAQAPYLRVHPDPYCTRAGNAQWSWAAAFSDISRALTNSGLLVPAAFRSIAILNKTDSGRARTLALEGDHTVPIAASSFRFAVGRVLGWNTLRSERYAVSSRAGRAVFLGSGEGHGVGLCQRGADEMGLEGSGYGAILSFYYPGTSLGVTATGFQWTRLGGEGLTVYTTMPERDRKLVGLAEGIAHDLSGQLHWPVPRDLEIRVYPDLDTFRNATGEPGWVAARTTGSRIELQPTDVLERHNTLKRTLRHEMLHAMLERQAAPGLPVWFREGLVGCLDGSNAPGGALEPDDSAIRQRQDRSQAVQAYAAARARVGRLINVYGETSVLGWLTSGLPPDVRNSSVNSDATNSK